MSQWNVDAVEAGLAQITDPLTGQDLKSSGVVRDVRVCPEGAEIDIRLGYPADDLISDLEKRVRSQLLERMGQGEVTVNISWRVMSHRVQGELKPHKSIRNIIAVGSGKGGVGKSSTAVNLALGLARAGAQVGILDADIYGPSIPRMLGVSGQPDTDGKRIKPKRAYGLQVMSIGFLVDEETPMVWRGPMVTSALQQLLSETDWEALDYLIIDLPPGTGDIQLTLAQKIPVAGAVIVTTPQDIALLDARKALQMFRKVGVKVLGVIENMSIHRCAQCGHEEAIFGHDGGVEMAAQYEIPLLGQLPLSPEIRKGLDQGKPTVAVQPDSSLAENYLGCARRTAAALSLQPRNLKMDLPQVALKNL